MGVTALEGRGVDQTGGETDQWGSGKPAHPDVDVVINNTEAAENYNAVYVGSLTSEQETAKKHKRAKNRLLDKIPSRHNKHKLGMQTARRKKEREQKV